MISLVRFPCWAFVAALALAAQAALGDRLTEPRQASELSPESMFAFYPRLESPPLVPQHEVIVSEDSPFAAQCRSVETKSVAAMSARIVRSVATLSFEWGPIWRGDVEYLGDRSIVRDPKFAWKTVTRVMCYRDRATKELVDVYAVFQQIPPLDPSTIAP